MHMRMVCCAMLFAALQVSAQKIPERFGKRIDNHVRSETCPIDSLAGAYVIYDHASVYYTYSDNLGFTWTMDRNMRIKILDKSELNQAEFKIYLYDINSKNESVGGLKAASYNLVNGKVVQTKLDRKDAITENVSEKLNSYNFAVPNVKEGSVIEVSYKLTSPFEYYLRNWNFQWDIPVLHSEIYLKIPEFFVYHQNMKGYHTLSTSELGQEGGMLNYTVKHDPNNKFSGRSIESRTMNYTAYTKHYIANNLPALESQPFVDNMENYRSSIEFELNRTEFGLDIENYATDWDAVTYQFMMGSFFGSKLNKTLFAKDDLEAILSSTEHPEERIAAIYYLVRDRIKWNGSTGFSSDQTLRNVYKEGSGRSTDINIILYNLLDEAGIEVYPVALSTRSNGLILPAFPSMDKLNNLVVLAKVGEQSILLDASEDHCPPGVLPVRCLNGRGRILDKDNPGWIDLATTGESSETNVYNLSLKEDATLEGMYQFKNSGYASINLKKSFHNAVDEEDYIKNLEESNPGLEILSCSFEGMEGQDDEVKGKYEITISDRVDFLGDRMVFNPMLFEQTESNPFKLEKRDFPVNYAYKRHYTNIINITLPEGYTIESMPEPAKLTNQDRSLSLVYSISAMGNRIQVMEKLDINKPLFISTEYAELKQFYEYLVKKEAEQIIVIKSATP